ncbi:MAG: helix-turn-helix domain-containing protein [Lachnospiraceae bacterium]|nr:helix-turn-helix domain-containing protein [Lachnospiraceae bacterium]
MGDGKNLKKILDEKGMNVRQIARKTGISPTTLYSLIQRDSNLRFDYALRIANELEIDVNSICEASPFSGALQESEIYPSIPNDIYGLLDETRVKGYLKNSLYPLMYLYGKNHMPDVDNLLTSFYQLDDEARKEVVDTVRLKLEYHRDPKRAEDIKQIKGW